MPGRSKTHSQDTIPEDKDQFSQDQPAGGTKGGKAEAEKPDEATVEVPGEDIVQTGSKGGSVASDNVNGENITDFEDESL